MLEKVVVSPDFRWFDLLNPSRGELEELARKHGLPASLVQDSLQPEHLPKFERFDGFEFLILRAFDQACPRNADTVRELTRKVAIFYRKDLLITVHRLDQPFLRALRERWTSNHSSLASLAPSASAILDDLITSVLGSYSAPIDAALDELENLEMGVFGAEGSHPFKIREGYYLRRRASVFRRMLYVSRDLLPRIGAESVFSSTQIQDLREQAEHLHFYAEELMDGVTSLLNLHLSLASHKTNLASHRTGEVVRVLTIFSVFILPLTVLTGIYGMNFQHMPELAWPYGYPAALGAMLAVETAIFFWFKRKGWLR